MAVQFSVTTERLFIDPLTINDAAFIFELVNSEGWLTFIGNRNISSLEDATDYINKTLNNNNVCYWTVKLKVDQQKIGIVTFIKRDYLDHHDIGFAFLPNFCKQGFAYEASSAVLRKLIDEKQLSHIYATTVPANASSIELIKKIGLVFEKEIELENDKLHVYGAVTENL